MFDRRLPRYGLVVCLVLFGLGTSYHVGRASGAPDAAVSTTARPVTSRVSGTYGRLPLSFEANRGQTDAQVKFLTRGPGYTLFLTETEAVFSLCPPQKAPRASRGIRRPAARRAVPSVAKARPAVVRMKLVGANSAPQIEGLDTLPGKVNYFLGSDATKWRTDIPTYARVRYREVWPGVDLVFHGSHRRLEYDFVVAPHADPSAIRLAFEGADRLTR